MQVYISWTRGKSMEVSTWDSYCSKRGHLGRKNQSVEIKKTGKLLSHISEKLQYLRTTLWCKKGEGLIQIKWAAYEQSLKWWSGTLPNGWSPVWAWHNVECLVVSRARCHKKTLPRLWSIQSSPGLWGIVSFFGRPYFFIGISLSS